MTNSSAGKDAAAKPLPSNTIAVMMHKHYLGRVEEHLLQPLHSQIPWKTVSVPRPSGDASKDSSSSKDKKGDEEKDEEKSVTAFSHQNSNTKNWSILDSTERTGVSHARRGFFVAMAEDTVREIHLISPMARQNIAWAYKLTHQVQDVQLISASPFDAKDEKGQDTVSTTAADTPTVREMDISQLAEEIAQTFPLNDVALLCQKDSVHKLRVDVYPKQYTDEICLGLQKSVHAILHKDAVDGEAPPVPDDPYEGPVKMTMSGSKCSHRLAIIISATASEDVTPATAKVDDMGDSKGDDKDKATPSPVDNQHRRIVWGLMDRTVPTDKNLMELRVNEFGAKELENISPDHKTGKEVGGKIVDPNAPVSRAFYKLDQVFHEIFESPQEVHVLDTLRSVGASAADLGSCPGGWTQVLARRMAKRNGDDTQEPMTICSVDQGTLAERAASLPGVKYVRGLMEDSQTIIEPFGPFGIVVSDASLLWTDLLELFCNKIATTTTATATSASKNIADDDKAGEEPPVKRKKEEEPAIVAKKNKFTLPCILVVTMKLPFQTINSVQRHVRWLDERVPVYLSRMATAMYYESNPDGPLVQARFIIKHLMANSSSERTLIAIFEPAPVITSTP